MLKNLMLGVLLAGVSTVVNAQEKVLSSDDISQTEVSIYNQNLALIKDVRQAKLNVGVSKVAFEGVAQQMMPESVIISGEGIKVLEQNYEYDLLTPENILEGSVGKEVKTVITNPENGKQFFDKAKIVSNNYGNPVLQFSYGIETNYNGRLVFDKLPPNLRTKPTLAAKIACDKALNQPLQLAYLTSGLSWSANYVAELGEEGTMDLQGFVTLNNNSGADYKDAKVKLIVGEVNQVDNIKPRLMAGNMLMAKSVGAAADMAESASMPAMSLGDYYAYYLPQKTDILNKQSKQVSLMSADGVKISKKYKMVSPLYIAQGSQGASFEKKHPQLLYKLVNDEESKLGMPLPAGAIRFYMQGSDGSSEFVGASNLTQLAKGEKAELEVGQAFDIFAEGQIKKVQKLADKMFEAEMAIVFNNAKKTAEKVEFVQNFNGSVEVVSENLSSDSKQVNQLQWEVEIPAEGKTVLNYKVRISKE